MSVLRDPGRRVLALLSRHGGSMKLRQFAQGFTRYSSRERRQLLTELERGGLVKVAPAFPPPTSGPTATVVSLTEAGREEVRRLTEAAA